MVSEYLLNSRGVKCLIDFKDYTATHTSNTQRYHGNQKTRLGLRSTIIWDTEREKERISLFVLLVLNPSEVFAQSPATMDPCQTQKVCVCVFGIGIMILYKTLQLSFEE